MKAPLGGLVKFPDRNVGWFLLLPFLAFAPTLLHGQCFFANDLLGFFGPFGLFFRSSLAQGVFPLWNPYNFAGQPFAADPQVFAFYPFFYPTLLFPAGWGLTLFLGFHLFLAAYGAGNWLKAFGCNATAQILGGCVFPLSGFFQIELIHPPMGVAAAWLPWCFGGVEKVLREPSRMNFFALGAAGSMLFLSGSYQIVLLGFYSLAAYAAIRIALNPPAEPLLKCGIHRAFPALALGLLPLFLSLVPLGEFISHCSRWTHPQGYEAFNARGSMDPSQIASFLWPPAPGNIPLGDAIQQFDAKGDSPLQTIAGFVGPASLAAALLGLFTAGWRRTLPLAALAAIGGLLAFGSHAPFHRMACLFFPGFSLFQMPFRYIVLSDLAVSVLAGLAFHDLLERFGRRRPWHKPALLAWIIAPALFGPLLSVGWGFYATGPASNFDFQTNSVYRQSLQAPPPPERDFLAPSLPYRVFYGRNDFFLAFPVDACAVMGVRNATGYNPLYLESYARLQSLPLDRFARLLSAPVLSAGRAIEPYEGFQASRAGPFYRLTLETPTADVKFPVRIRVVPEDRDAWAILRESSFDPEKEAVLTLPRGMSPPTAPETSDGFSARLVSDSPNRQDYSMDAPQAGIAVFPDAAFPGWRAEMDGHETPVLTAQGALRAVAIPPGAHRLVFRFRPFWWPWMPIALVLWLLSVPLILLTNRKSRNA